MSARIVAVLITLAFLLGVGGALWAVGALRAPEPSTVDPIELEEDDGSGERERGEERKRERKRPRTHGGGDRQGTQAPSEGAPVAPPPPPEEFDDDDDDDDDDGGDDGDD